jgi:hypothetical protein
MYGFVLSCGWERKHSYGLLQRRPALREKNRKLVARTGRKKGPRLMKSGRNEKSKNSETERVQEREREKVKLIFFKSATNGTALRRSSRESL